MSQSPKTEPKELTICFILPFVNLTGGIKILFEHANQLVKLGHHVTIIYPGVIFHGDYQAVNNSWQWRIFEAPFRQLKYWIFVDIFKKTEASWFPLDSRIILKRTPDLSAKYIPESDIVIATACETVEWVAHYPSSKGIKVNFAQDYEVWALPEKFVDKTFSYTDMHLITIGNWQKKLFTEKFKRQVEAVIPDGVDLQRFKPKMTTKNMKADTIQPIRILMSYHHLPYKGIKDGLKAIEIVQRKLPDIQLQLVMFGVHPLIDQVPEHTQYYQNLSEDELPAVYQSCDIFVWPTHREGFGLPPMEAMACGLPVVGTDAGAMTDYTQNGITGFIVPIKQPEKLAEKLSLLVSNQALRLKMGQAAAESMKAWGWDQQTENLAAYLEKLWQKERIS